MLLTRESRAERADAAEVNALPAEVCKALMPPKGVAISLKAVAASPNAESTLVSGVVMDAIIVSPLANAVVALVTCVATVVRAVPDAVCRAAMFPSAVRPEAMSVMAWCSCW